MKRVECSRCKRPDGYCYCHLLRTPLDNRWPVHILQHKQEAKHPIGTARIAELGLRNCHMTTRFDERLQGKDSVLVYPGEEAMNLDELSRTEPHELLFIDASWRKSRRMLFENPELAQLPRVSFHPESVSRYKIRKEPDAHLLSTLEAIVYVLSYLENNDDKYEPLLQAMDFMIDSQIQRMGQETFRKNYSKD